MRKSLNFFKRGLSLREKLMVLVLMAAVPFIVIFIYLLYSMNSYGQAYDSIINNVSRANNYNLDFKEQTDESLYRMVARNILPENMEAEEDVKNPYVLIHTLQKEMRKLSAITTDEVSRSYLTRVIRNTNTLKKRVDDICVNIKEGDKYDVNIEMLNNNIYILTELIQDDIQNYIFYQTRNMDGLRQKLNQQLSQFTYICIVLTALVGLFVALFAVRLTREIIQSINQLCFVTDQVAEGNFSVRASISTKDEMEKLARSVNSMTSHIEELVTTIKEDERRMRHAELRLLQEQINPHFLYNTLDTIVWLIESGETDNAEEMVVSLSTFFRLVLSHGQEFITIREEERHIRSYLEIQQVRYKDILDYEIDISPEIYDCRILKLTLQPLVENALYHGIKYKRAKGLLKISGSLEGDLVKLTVTDDGAGMSPEKLEELRLKISRPCNGSEGGFGLANVSERIRMNFGPEYGMQIDSREGQGTVILITLPAEKAGQEKKSGDKE